MTRRIRAGSSGAKVTTFEERVRALQGIGDMSRVGCVIEIVMSSGWTAAMRAISSSILGLTSGPSRRRRFARPRFAGLAVLTEPCGQPGRANTRWPECSTAMGEDDVGCYE